jgi:hypothetical protein
LLICYNTIETINLDFNTKPVDEELLVLTFIFIVQYEVDMVISINSDKGFYSFSNTDDAFSNPFLLKKGKYHQLNQFNLMAFYYLKQQNL